MFRVGLLILVVATAAWRWWTISHWSWFADDWIYLYETQQQGFLAYVFQGYNSHLMPGQFLVTWLITAWQPLDFGLAAVVLTLFAVASLLAWAAALREIFGEKVQLLLPLLLLALSPLLLMPTVWFASGVQVLPLQLFMGLSVLFLARYVLRGGRRRDVVWLVVSFAAGLFFWEKALLIMIPVAFVGYLLVEGSPVARIRRLVPVLAAPTVLAAVYAVVYLTTRRSGAIGIQTTQFAPRSFGEWWEFMTASMRNIGLPTIAGGPFEPMHGRVGQLHARSPRPSPRRSSSASSCSWSRPSCSAGGSVLAIAHDRGLPAGQLGPGPQQRPLRRHPAGRRRDRQVRHRHRAGRGADAGLPDGTDPLGQPDLERAPGAPAAGGARRPDGHAAWPLPASRWRSS